MVWLSRSFSSLVPLIIVLEAVTSQDNASLLPPFCRETISPSRTYSRTTATSPYIGRAGWLVKQPPTVRFLFRKCPTKRQCLIPHFSFSGEVILSTTYGLDIALKDDKYIKLAKAGVDPVVPALNPGTYLVDVIPALKYVPDWMPGAGFKKTAKKCHLLAQAMKDSPFEAAQYEIVSSLVIPWNHL